MFDYQLIFITLELKKNKSTEYVIGWISKGLHKSSPLLLDYAFLPNIKYFLSKKQYNSITPL